MKGSSFQLFPRRTSSGGASVRPLRNKIYYFFVGLKVVVKCNSGDAKEIRGNEALPKLQTLPDDMN